jgi:hypothetical protein
MRYSDTLLAEGEAIILRRRQHWLALLIEGRLALALWLVGLLLLVSVPFLRLQPPESDWISIAALVSIGLGLIIFGYRYWQWWAQDYIVTNRRLMKVTGILNKKSSDSSLEKINDAILDQNIVGRILNYGDMDILTASGELAVDYFRMLNGAKEFKRVMLNQKHALEMEYRYGAAPSPPLRATPVDMNDEPVPAPAAPAEPPARAAEPPASAQAAEPPAETAAAPDASLDVTRTLARLADLRDRGAISESEYEAKKDELLGRL